MCVYVCVCVCISSFFCVCVSESDASAEGSDGRRVSGKAAFSKCVPKQPCAEASREKEKESSASDCDDTDR